MTDLKPCHCGDRLATHVLTPEGTFCLDCMHSRKNRRAPRFSAEETKALDIARIYLAGHWAKGVREAAPVISKMLDEEGK